MSTCYIVTEEPYHENSTIVGVFLSEEKALEFIVDRPNHAPVNSFHRPEVWQVWEWCLETNTQLREWCLRWLHTPSKFKEGGYSKGPWVLQEGRVEDSD